MTDGPFRLLPSDLDDPGVMSGFPGERFTEMMRTAASGDPRWPFSSAASTSLIDMIRRRRVGSMRHFMVDGSIPVQVCDSYGCGVIGIPTVR